MAIRVLADITTWLLAGWLFIVMGIILLRKDDPGVAWRHTGACPGDTGE